MGWDGGFDIRDTPSGLVTTRLEQGIDVLGLMGVRVNPSSRQREALRRLKTFDGYGMFDPKIDAAKRVAEDLVLIVSAAYGCRRPDTPFSHDKLKRMLDDALVPSRRRSPGRDWQFELLLAAMFHLGGAEVMAGEPDFRITYRGETIGVASEADHQLEAEQAEHALARQCSRSADPVFGVGLPSTWTGDSSSAQRVDDGELLRVTSDVFNTVQEQICDDRWD
ncbi:hypothetical protein [Candidatus Palauibacter sp.]|uniref:hypothetical protein n=1 Tax=Candidatus Palauibacter sp. TaxID=3101350 RepID=UPI003B51811D